MDQQLIKDTIKVLKDFGKFWTELYKIVSTEKGLPSLISTWATWGENSKTGAEATKAALTSSKKTN